MIAGFETQNAVQKQTDNECDFDIKNTIIYLKLVACFGREPGRSDWN